MTDPATVLVHATAVAIAGRAVLILGSSGSGKSDLALRLITTPLLHDGKPLEVRLVSDDQVIVERQGDRLFASPPPTIAGRLEVRGIGILPVASVQDALDAGSLWDLSSPDENLGADLYFITNPAMELSAAEAAFQRVFEAELLAAEPAGDNPDSASDSQYLSDAPLKAL